MSVDPRHGRYCDECGRLIEKAHRIFEEKDYCTSCYARVFGPAACAKCGSATRVHRLATGQPLCRRCAIAERVCQRCGKPVPRAGLISAGKVVCPACVPYFAPKAPCERCGVMSSRLSRAPSLGIEEKVCPSCRNKVTHRTCSACRKYRKVVGHTEQGRPYCAACQPHIATTHACPGCGSVVTGDGAARCRPCSNLDRLRRETALHVLGFNRDWVRRLYETYAGWLHEEQPHSPSLLRKFAASAAFFEQLDVSFVEMADVTGPRLLEVFGTRGLRKHLLASRFLLNALVVDISDAQKRDFADRELVRDKLARATKQPWGSLLKGYHDWLVARPLPIRTVRLYLTAAENFCVKISLTSKGPWSAEAIKRFLTKHPGSRASLAQFVTYCKARLEWAVEMPVNNPRGRSGFKTLRTVSELRRLLVEIQETGVDHVNKPALTKILAKSFGLRIRSLRSGEWAVEKHDERYWLRSTTENVEIPVQLEAVARAYISSETKKENV